MSQSFPEWLAEKYGNPSGITCWFENGDWVIKEFPAIVTDSSGNTHRGFPAPATIAAWKTEHAGVDFSKRKAPETADTKLDKLLGLVEVLSARVDKLEGKK
jgi:hypothetical protein